MMNKTPFSIKRRKFKLDIERVEKFRKAEGLTKTELAKRLFVIQTVVSYIYRKAPVKWAPEIAKIFGLEGKDFIKEIEVTEEIENIDLHSI